jgi:pimeloyl-ACP methyl ester carboxylesterase
MGILRNYAAFIGRDHYERASELSVPVKIVHGTADTVVPVRRAHVLHRLIAQSELHLLPGLGHGLFYYEEARELLRSLLVEPRA